MKYKQDTLKGIYKRVVGSMSGLSDVGVELHEQTCPHFDPTDNVVRMPTEISWASNEEESFHLGRGIVVHEAGHVLFAPDFDTKEQEEAEFFNVFADVNNEWKVVQLWPHLKKPLADKTTVLVSKKPELLKSDNPFMQILMRCEKISDLKPEYPKDYNPILKKFVETTSQEFHKQGIAEATGDELVKFTREVYRQWCKLHQQQKEKQHDINNLMKELGDLIKNGATNEDIKAKNAEIKKAAGNRAKFKDKVVGVRKVPKPKEENYNKLTLEELKERLKEAKEKVNDSSGGGWGCSNIENDQVVLQMEPGGEENIDYDDKEAYKKGKIINRMLKRKIALQDDYEKRHRSGRIDLDEVRRQVSMAGRIYKESVFERNNSFTRGGEWAIEVLVDCSGSMNGHKMSAAKQLFATLGHALDGIPNVHYALTGFQAANGVTDIIIKKFRDRRIDFKKLNKLQADNANADGYNIRESANRLLKFRNMKKIMVVISDGQPAYKNGIEDTKKAVQQSENMGISVIGIGIDGCTEQSLRNIYPNNYLFKDTDDMPNDITNLILSSLGQKEKKKLVKTHWEK